MPFWTLIPSILIRLCVQTARPRGPTCWTGRLGLDLPARARFPESRGLGEAGARQPCLPGTLQFTDHCAAWCCANPPANPWRLREGKRFVQGQAANKQPRVL